MFGYVMSIYGGYEDNRKSTTMGERFRTIGTSESESRHPGHFENRASR